MPHSISTHFYQISQGKHELRSTIAWINLLYNLKEMELTNQDLSNIPQVLQDPQTLS